MRSRQNIAVTVDTVVFCNSTEKKLLLIKRKNEPFKGKWALPGGFLEEDESFEEGAKRELEEETGLQIKNLQQIGAFGNPGRDPRGRTISIAYLGRIDFAEEVQGNDDAAEAKWFELPKLPDLAFDHQEIVNLALNKLKTEK